MHSKVIRILVVVLVSMSLVIPSSFAWAVQLNRSSDDIVISDIVGDDNSFFRSAGNEGDLDADGAAIDSDFSPSVDSKQDVTESAEASENDTHTESVDEQARVDQGTDSETAESLISNDDSDSEERAANSWRYSNGKPVHSGEYSARSSSGAWEKTDSGYVNSVGDVIPGATLRGIDVSEFQYTINWNAVKADDVSFAILRAAAWDGEIDATWERNAQECERLGIPYGAYIYSYATTASEAVSEAKYIISLVQGHTLSYPIYIDLEDNTIANADLNAVAEAFCRTIESAGYDAGVYANTTWWNNKLTSPVLDN